MAFEQIHGDYSGENLAQIVHDSLHKNNLCDKLHCVTTDNASNNNTMVESLSTILKQEDNVIWNHNTRHVRCLAHIINLVVADFLKGISSMSRDILSRAIPTDLHSWESIPVTIHER